MMNETTLSIAEDLETMLSIGFSGSELAETYGPRCVTKERIMRPVGINSGPTYFDMMVFDDASIIAFSAPENDEVQYRAYRPGTTEWVKLMLIAMSAESITSVH